jgi:hypothetical protein
MNNGDSGFFNAYVGVTSSKTAAIRSEHGEEAAAYAFSEGF